MDTAEPHLVCVRPGDEVCRVCFAQNTPSPNQRLETKDVLENSFVERSQFPFRNEGLCLGPAFFLSLWSQGVVELRSYKKGTLWLRLRRTYLLPVEQAVLGVRASPDPGGTETG